MVGPRETTYRIQVVNSLLVNADNWFSPLLSESPYILRIFPLVSFRLRLQLGIFEQGRDRLVPYGILYIVLPLSSACLNVRESFLVLYILALVE